MATPPMWQRRHILMLHVMMREARPKMTPENYAEYINLWADVVASSNPLFQRDRFMMECYRTDA